ncbi:RagB/SusD family nutrient uptake outer membrane protein [Gemmatimonas phototrophica]|uniref:RagB/SusD domain-containing protein n=1 Tax=Gemmatimonas phototrophica TaxID=1379270 RepID=A0A143BIV6_9BACT|nr:RagB/SusD family nutrient uptake outer membrane protein [Gemmatimonas phototrophica]AMW04482.1 hypothetical protein GEMMAAP_05760 [Gemmatimonas phototrophica]
MTMNFRALVRTAPVAVLALFAGCDLKVTNPGPIQAEFLDNTAALTAVVNGAGRDLAEALNWTAYTGAAVTKEVLPSGSTAAFGISVRQQLGVLSNDDGGDWWNQAQRARWTAENGVARIKEVLPTSATSATLAQGLIWVGFSNRHLGENFCDCVIDGGAKQAHTVYFERAEAAFSEAITVATAANNATLRDVATAGRASVRLLRGNLSGASADAALITNNAFVYRMPYYVNTVAQYNRIYWASASQPYRAHTVWGTFYENYRRTTRDPRVPFDSSLTIRFGDAAVASLGGQVRWYFQTKYPVRESSINLASGWEMRLIEAEALLVGGDINGALAKMNIRRTALNLPLLTAANATDAWVALKRERGIELWLEGRRMGDQRRWATLNRPGVSDDMTGRNLCFPIPLSELETNPNLR